MTIYSTFLKAARAAIEYGYKPVHMFDSVDQWDLHAPNGKFEGEPFYAVYFADTALLGDHDEPLYDGDDIAADIIPVTDDERAAFRLHSDTHFIALWYSVQGFISLQELSCKAYDDLRARYEQTEE